MGLANCLCALVILGLVIDQARGHAYLAYPPSRNAQAFELGLFYCPHCGQGSGKVPSMCGDRFQAMDSEPDPNLPFTERFYGYGATLSEGQVVTVNITVSTNHGGRMRMSVCPKPRQEVDQACFDQPENWMLRVNTDPKYNNKVYWYLNQDNNQVAIEKFRLPDGISCNDGCMMQWWWVGEQSCTLPCEDPSIDVPGECNYNPMNPSVTTCTNINRTEQFYNCADIIITGPGGSTQGKPQRVRLWWVGLVLGLMLGLAVVVGAIFLRGHSIASRNDMSGVGPGKMFMLGLGKQKPMPPSVSSSGSFSSKANVFMQNNSAAYSGNGLSSHGLYQPGYTKPVFQQSFQFSKPLTIRIANEPVILSAPPSNPGYADNSSDQAQQPLAPAAQASFAHQSFASTTQTSLEQTSFSQTLSFPDVPRASMQPGPLTVGLHRTRTMTYAPVFSVPSILSTISECSQSHRDEQDLPDTPTTELSRRTQPVQLVETCGAGRSLSFAQTETRTPSETRSDAESDPDMYVIAYPKTANEPMPGDNKKRRL